MSYKQDTHLMCVHRYVYSSGTGPMYLVSDEHTQSLSHMLDEVSNLQSCRVLEWWQQCLSRV